MDLIWTSFVLGLVGSLHCAGMCGPLALAIPPVGNTRISFTTGRLLYSAGRLLTYSLIGVLFGLLGRSLVLAGLQRSISLSIGLALLGLLALSLTGRKTGGSVWTAVGFLKRAFGSLLARRSYLSLFLLGALNGLLPCGLVYVAAAGATATGAIGTGLLYMLCFGLGTLPVMLGLGLAGKRLQARLRFRYDKLIPISVACIAMLLVLRGMSLGIPYLSPVLTSHPTATATCH